MATLLVSIFRVLAHACPPDFRREYGAAMRRDFEEGLRDELCVHGPLAALTFACGAYVDLFLTALREFTAMIFRDLVFALRSLRKTPVFAGVVVATLAIAIAANASVFSILRAIVLTPLPYPDSARIVALLGTKDGLPFSLSLPDFRDVSLRTRSFTSLAAFSPRNATLTGKGVPERLAGVSTTPGLFETLGVRPVLGRAFTDRDARAGSAATVIISETLWRSAFGSDPLAIGANLELDGKAYRVIGVVPATLRQPNFDDRELEDESFWVPLDPNSTEDRYGRGAHYFQAVGRLRPGVDIVSARAELDAIFARVARANPAEDNQFGIAVASAYETIVGNVRPLLVAIFAAVAGVLLVACANVANLLLGRAASRDREFAIRTAIGASRGRLITQLLVETFVFAAAGGVLGSGFAAFVIRAFVAAHPAGLPRVDDVRFDAPSALYTLAIVALCTIVAGVAPALALSRRSLADALKSAGRGGDGTRGARARAVLVIAEVALTLALVVSSGLELRSFIALTSQPLGFEARDLTAANVAIPPSASSDALVRAFLTRVGDRVRALPGVEGVAWCYSAPFTRRTFDLSFDFANHRAPAGASPSTEIDVVGPAYFATLRQNVLAGRSFKENDLGFTRVAVVNEAFVRKFYRNGQALGNALTLGMSDDKGRPEITRIVGIVANARSSYGVPPPPELYLPIGSIGTPNMLLLIRAQPGSLSAPVVGAAFTAADPLVARPKLIPYAQYLLDNTAQTRLAAVALGALAFVALALSLAGIFAIVSFGVAQRTHEFGVRMALGAQAWHVIRSAVSNAMRLVGVGVVLGLIVATFTTRLLSNQLYGVAPLDPLTFGTVAAAIVLAAFVAALVPASRATRVDPVVALRYD